MKNENIALISAVALIVAILAATTVLLVTGTLTLAQVGPFLLALLIPISAIAGLPMFKAALNAPSPEQNLRLEGIQSAIGNLVGQANTPQAAGVLHVIVHPTEGASVIATAVPPEPEPQPIILPTPVNRSQEIPDMATQSVPAVTTIGLLTTTPAPQSATASATYIPPSPIDLLTTSAYPVPPLPQVNFHDSGFLPTMLEP